MKLVRAFASVDGLWEKGLSRKPIMRVMLLLLCFAGLPPAHGGAPPPVPSQTGSPPAQTASPPAQTPAPLPTAPGFVGGNACKTCHADVWLNFYKNPHFKSIASGKEPPEKTGCEGCHGGAKAH